MTGIQAAMLPDGRRLHLQHGPIDLIIEAFGSGREVAQAYRQAQTRFETVLSELVEELHALRTPCGSEGGRLRGRVARRMETAAKRHLPAFITPMAAVAGSVADEVLSAMVEGRDLARAYVNNGGDIAVHLGPSERLDAAIAGTGRPNQCVTLRVDAPSRGMATSGWRGRSKSFGIADAVTVLARDAASADAAATIIANAVDLADHPAVQRLPAIELDPDSDLGMRPVTVGVGPLLPEEVSVALDAGLAAARDLRARGIVDAAALFLAGESRCCGALALAPQGEAPALIVAAAPA